MITGTIAVPPPQVISRTSDMVSEFMTTYHDTMIQHPDDL